MSRKKPKSGYRNVSVFAEDGIRIYADATVEALAREFGIEGESAIERLDDQLEGAAQIYRNCKNDYDDAPRPGHVRAALTEIRDLSSQLRTAVENLDDVSRELFWQPEIQIRGNPGPLEISKSESETTRFGHVIQRLPARHGGHYVCVTLGEDHYETLDVLKNLAEYALGRIPDDTGAQRPSEALRMWVINIHKYWTDILGRKFTLTIHEGQPASDAAVFCCKAFKEIDPSVPHSRIMGEMRKLNARQSRTKKRNNPAKN